MDYGGGNGLLSLLARESRVGTVIYTDIEAASTADARRLASAIGLQADHYIAGELEDVTRHVRLAGIGVDAVCSYDVIEYIYDIDEYLREVPTISTEPLRLVFASGAKNANPRIRRQLMPCNAIASIATECRSRVTSQVTLPKPTCGSGRTSSALGRPISRTATA